MILAYVHEYTLYKDAYWTIVIGVMHRMSDPDKKIALQNNANAQARA